jgi:hypothetical protein
MISMSASTMIRWPPTRGARHIFMVEVAGHEAMLVYTGRAARCYWFFIRYIKSVLVKKVKDIIDIKSKVDGGGN